MRGGGAKGGTCHSEGGRVKKSFDVGGVWH